MWCVSGGSREGIFFSATSMYIKKTNEESKRSSNKIQKMEIQIHKSSTAD